MTAVHWWRHGLNQLSAWLPALLMLLFALGTWWLVRSAPQLGAGDAESPVSHEPDYNMRRFSVRSFDPTGRLKSELTGAEGHHYPDTDTLAIRAPRIRSYDERGQPTVGSAERGVSNGDGTVIQLYGGARVAREAVPGVGRAKVPRLEFRGEYLQAWTREERVSSNQPVELWRGDDRFAGDAFDYDNRTGIANLRGHVRAVLQPASRTPAS